LNHHASIHPPDWLWSALDEAAVMKTFTINPANHVRACASNEETRMPDGGAKFASEKELTALAAHWPGKRLVEIWNKLSGVETVRKFTDRKTAVRRIWRAIQDLEPARAEQARTGARKGPGLGKAAAGAEQPVVGRDSTKTERIIALLKQPSGATLKAIMAVTGWQSHSVRGFISAQLTKRMGFRIKSFKRDGERVYRIRT
jgi:hypothetical protein